MQKPCSHKDLSNQRTTSSGERRSEECRSGDGHLEWPSFKKCVPEGSDYFQQTLGRRRSSSLKIKLSSSKEYPSINKEYEDLNSWRTAYPPQHLDKKLCYHEWRRWWSWRLKEYTHETNKDKYSIVISWYCFVMHLFIFSWCVMHDRLFALMTVYY